MVGLKFCTNTLSTQKNPLQKTQIGFPRNTLNPKIWAGLLTGIAGLIFTLFTFLQWHTLESFSWDQGIFTQLAKAYSHLEIPIVPIKGAGYNLWGDHFHPILLLLGPVYALFPSGITLLVVQAWLLAGSAYPLTRYAVQNFGTLLGTLTGISYALSWGLQSAIEVQFHEICVAVFLLAGGLVAWLEGRATAALVWLLPLVIVKEDIGVTLAALGVVTFFSSPFSKRWRRRLAIVFTLVGIGGTALAVMVVIPAFSKAGAYEYLGQVTSTNPFVTLFTDWTDKTTVVAALVIAGGIMAVRSGIFWLVVPTLAWRFTANVPNYWGISWQYSAVLMPMVFAAFLHWGTSRLGFGFRAGFAPKFGVGLSGEVNEGSNTCSSRRKAVLAGAVVVSLAINCWLLPGKPVWRVGQAAGTSANILATFTPSVPPPVAKLEKILSTAPAKKPYRVLTDIYLLAYLVPYATVGWIGWDKSRNIDPQIIVTSRGSYPSYVAGKIFGQFTSVNMRVFDLPQGLQIAVDPKLVPQVERAFGL